MQQDYSSLNLKKIPKNYAQKRKLESHIFKKLIKEGELYQVFTKNEATRSAVNIADIPGSPEAKVEALTNRMLPTIAQPAMQRYEANFQLSDKINKKQPKLHPILKYNSQKWLSAAKAKTQQEYLYKGKKKFEIKTTRLSQERPKNKVRKSDPGPFMNLFLRKGGAAGTEKGEESPSHDLSQGQVTKQTAQGRAPARSLQQKLRVGWQKVARKEESVGTKSSYFKLSEPITGWNTTQLQYDPYF